MSDEAGSYFHTTTPGGLFALVRDGRADSRSALSHLTGLAMSTVGMRVDELIRAGYLVEAGAGASRGGRRPRSLAVAADGRLVAGVDLGARHANIALFDLARAKVAARSLAIDVARGPEEVLANVHRAILDLVGTLDGEAVLVGIGLAVPGPVSVPGGRVVSPSRMPGWNGVDPAALLTAMSGVVTRVENDANAMAVGEYIATGRAIADLVLVKAGSSIGAGVIAAGAPHRGFRGMAGDVSHTPVAGAPAVLCSCGRLGCLDAVAGGTAIARDLRAAGVEAGDTTGVLDLAHDAHPLATRLLREAGTRVGAVLANVVHFFNPQRLVLAGSLSAADAFCAGVRSSVYDLCLPMSTDGLEITVSAAGADGGSLGAAALVLDGLLDAAAVDRALRKRT
ncbi:putative NBD/HSP70 family sugar kinase [Streptosporangium becharense]|uniref:Putative NBD/HSP70 family sugar kinase n=1 Tax=Streptosporangium becharense TaxID=1816182 RepID=A0A7W9ILM9_9ACTN|nr:ROK family protein [Streptosporangium becharense]MBB2910281.1 putative NBD/HSP70 family sugar kinase [Streptosporangium becharense]MBB5823024.1 putative NBD/HSP70 family sugar kinase [Streptosporangium becharense]